MVGLERLVAELPEGLDTKIGSGKRALSGGQAQRIALARAFLDKKRKVMIFDEPTAHLDIETGIGIKRKNDATDARSFGFLCYTPSALDAPNGLYLSHG